MSIVVGSYGSGYKSSCTLFVPPLSFSVLQSDRVSFGHRFEDASPRAENPAGCYIDQNLTCDVPIEQSFYKAPFGSWQCYNCACDIKEQNIIDQIEEKLLSFSTVKPSCSSKCGPMITKFPRRVRKNKGGSSGRPKKKARR